MSYLRAIYFWLFMLIWTPFLFTIIWIHRLIYNLMGGQEFDQICHRYAALWARGVMAAMPFWRVEISGQEYMPKEGEPVVMAINHESMADIWGLFCVHLQFKWLSKAEVFKIPLVGPAMGWARYIPIKRGDKTSHMEALRASSETLARGIPMVFFPEGTRSEDGRMRPFKVGAFKLAEDNDVAIQPVVMKGSGNLIRKGSGLPFPATIRIKFLPATRKDNAEDLDQYAERVRQQLIAAHQLI